MIHISLDFETFSMCDLKKSGAWKYSEHPTTEILLASYKLHCEDAIHTYRCDHGNIESMHLLFDMLRETRNYRVHAWNANFERAIWLNVAVKKLGWPEIPLPNWVDDQAIAAYHAFPLALGLCAEVLRLPIDVQKDKTGKALINKFSKPRIDRTTKEPIRCRPEDAPEDFNAFVEYNKQDIITEIAVVEALPTQSIPQLQQIGWIIDSRINERGVPIDKVMVDSTVKILERYKDERLTELSDITQGRITSAGQTAKIKQFLATQGLELDDVTKDTIAKALPDATDDVKTILEIRQQLSKSSTAKYQAMQDTLCSDSTIKGAFQYLGATRTGRWAGRSVQFQNFPRRNPVTPSTLDAIRANDYDVLAEQASKTNSSVFDILSSALRQAIKAPDSYKLGIVDYSSIENRIAAWLSADTKTLQSFENERDQYKEFAARIFNVHYDQVTKEQRTFAKPVVLGAAYGMGAVKLQASAKTYGLDMSNNVAVSLLHVYHETYPNIREIHHLMDKAAKSAIKNPGLEVKAGNRCYGYVIYYFDKPCLFCELPSGRTICYPFAKTGKKDVMTKKGLMTFDTITFKNAINGKWVDTDTYASKLFENVCQAISRDILLHAMINLQKAKIATIGTIHDEIIALLTNDQTLEDMTKAMLDKPDWAKTLPLDAEGFTSIRYEKR